MGPTKAIGSIPQNDKFEILDVEMKNDPLCYSGGGRVRVGVAGSKICDWFMGGGLKLMTVPFITFHSVGDNLTDPEGRDCWTSRQPRTRLSNELVWAWMLTLTCGTLSPWSLG